MIIYHMDYFFIDENKLKGGFMEKIIIIGCGGHAKSLVDIIEREGIYTISGFVEKYVNSEFEYRGYKILGSDDELESIFQNGIKYAAVGIGYMGKGTVRNKIYAKLKMIGFRLPIFIDPSAIVAKDVKIGEGTMVGKGAILNSGAVIGKMVIVNTAAILEHDCTVEDYSHVSVGAKLCGGVTVKNGCFIGAGTTVIQECHIGKNVLVGAGSLVLNNISDEKCEVGIIK